MRLKFSKKNSERNATRVQTVIDSFSKKIARAKKYPVRAKKIQSEKNKSD